MTISRRAFFETTATAVFAAAAFAAGTTLPAFAAVGAKDETVSTADLAVPGPLGDMVMGSDKAPVTIIEYASMTCSHCAHFQSTTFPELKKRYIDTGKVRYILREFPFEGDPVGLAGFMLARCAGEKDKSRYFAFADLMLTKQNLLFSAPKDKVEDVLRGFAKQAGITDKGFDECLANQKIVDGIDSVRQRAMEKFGVDSTPTFFINGKRVSGDQPIEKMAELIDPYLKS